MSGSWSNTLTTSLTLPTGAVPPDQRIVLNGATDTILVYSATGALIASVAATAGTDGLGNAYPAGISSTGGIVSQSIILIYNGTPGAGNLTGSWASSAGSDSFGNAYQAGLTVGQVNQPNIVLTPNASNTFNLGDFQAAVQLFTNDPNQMMPSMLGPVLQNAGATNEQMTTVLHSPIGSAANAEGYCVVLAADNDNTTTNANLTMGPVTTDGQSMNYTPVVSFDDAGNVVPNSVVTYGSKTSTVVTTFTTSGSHSFTVPSGVTSLKVECWGGGGGGQGGSGAGGGGGEYAAESALVVTSGHTYTFTVGAGGAGGPSGVGGPGSNGGTTSFAGDAKTVTAHGGQGSASATTVGGTGSTNAIHFNGGGSHANSTGVSTGGAGGGSSAGTAAAGNTGGSNSGQTAGVGATAPSGGGSGGNGGNGTGTGGVTGQAGYSPGGGGGTGGAGSSANAAGGAGGTGQVRITYTTPATNVVTASMAANSYTDTFGNTIPQGFNGANFAGISWTSYTPSWTAVSGTNPSIGNGTITGRYAVYGKTMFLFIQMTCGSTTTFGSAGVNWKFSLPVGFSAVSGSDINKTGTCVATPNGTGGKRNIGFFSLIDSTDATMDVWGPNADATASTTGYIDSTTPSTWTTAGVLVISGAFEIA